MIETYIFYDFILLKKNSHFSFLVLTNLSIVLTIIS